MADYIRKIYNNVPIEVIENSIEEVDISSITEESLKKFKREYSLLDGKKIVDEVSEKSDLVLLIKRILEKNKIKLHDIEIFEMNEGPGSFTGLKQSAAVVNALNWALGKKKANELIIPKYQKSAVDDIS